jgi:serine phosphatase RsbU (regulator of sigma subunit)/Tfp pilus assembly protein PilF
MFSLNRKFLSGCIIFLLLPEIFICNIDSLLQRLKVTKDTARINTLIRLADQYMFYGKMDDASKCLTQAGQENVRVKNKLCDISIALKTALYHYRKSEFRLSYELCEEILMSALEAGDKNKIGECKTLLGMNAGRLGDFKKALFYYQEALPLYESTGNIPGQMKVYSSIAGVYFDQLDYKMAVDYFKKTLEMAMRKDDKKVIGQTYNNIGSALQNMGKSSDARDYYLKAAEINLQSGNKNNLGYNYMNLASCELEEGDTKKAHEYNGKALPIFKEFNDPYSLVSCLNVEAEIFMKEKNASKAIETLERSVKIAEKTGSPVLMQRTYIHAAEAYEQAGDVKNALLYFKKHMRTKDSIINDEIREEVTKKQLHYEFDKKHLSDSLEAQSRQMYLQQEIENSKRRASLQRNISLISIFSFLVVTALAIVIYRGLKKNKEANRLIEQKSKEILDSFYYAKKIQAALLPLPELIRKELPGSFVLFKPRDIVSGDFYWMHKIERDQRERKHEAVLIAVGDCTGHGVPGAMVSVVCSNALNRAAREFGITEPGKILDKARELVIENLAESNTTLKDGMDVSLCKITFSKKDSVEIEWAGAYNPLWYSAGNIVIEIEADKQPIGFSEKVKPFATNEIEVSKGEMIYLFTDGFADQFGGPKGKKYKYRQLQESLLKVRQLEPDQQRAELEAMFESWKGELEQVDDVCIIGIRL